MNAVCCPTEAELVSRLKTGDEAACTTLVEMYGGRMLVAARRILRHDEDAADAVQDAFLAAFRAVGRFAGESSLGTWLHRIVVNAALMRRRSAARRPVHSIQELLPAFDATGHHAEPVCRWSGDASERVQSMEQRERLYACLDRLPPDYREVVLLRDIEQVDTDTAAARLQVSHSVVKTRLHRARQALRSLLNQELQDA